MYIEKDFDGMKFGGTVMSYAHDHQGRRMWHVQYTDGDEEDLFDDEIRPLLTEDPKIRTARYLSRRERAMHLFKHYPVLAIRCATVIES